MTSRPGSPARIIKELIGAVVGSMCFVVSGFVLLYFYAFASMVEPQRQSMDRWWAIFSNMFGLYEGIVAWPMLIIFLLSMWLIARSVIRSVFMFVQRP